jgi:phosphoribosylamine-glycine ligase
VIKNVAVWDKQASFGLQKILVDAGCFCFVFLKDSECSEEVVADGITLVFYSNVDQLPSLYDKHKIDFVFSTYPCEDILILEGRTYGHLGSSSNIEMDRTIGIDLIRQLAPELKIPETYTSLDKVTTDKVVVKAHGNHEFEIIGQKSFIIDKSDINYNEDILKIPAVFQNFIPGVEISFGGIFAGDHFVKPYWLIQEYKRRTNMSIGNTFIEGENGTIGKWVDKLPGNLEEILLKHAPLLKGYYGLFDINTMLYNGELYFLEYTCRMGYPTEYEIISSLEGSYLNFLTNIMNGKDFKVRSKFFASSIVSDMLWSYFNYGIKVPGNTNDFRTVPMSATKDGDKYTVRKDIRNCDLFLASGLGDTVEHAISNLYEGLKGTRGFAISYLEDIGRNWNDQIKDLTGT